MLILVSVSISIALNTGLFSKAGKAAGEMDNAQARENTLASGAITIDNVTYGSIDEYLNVLSGAVVHNWTRTGDSLTCSHCSATYTIGDEINYTPNTATNATTLTAEASRNRRLYIRWKNIIIFR